MEVTVARSRGNSPAMPRMPSVPKSFLIRLLGTFLNFRCGDGAADFAAGEAGGESISGLRVGGVAQECTARGVNHSISAFEDGERGEGGELGGEWREALAG